MNAETRFLYQEIISFHLYSKLQWYDDDSISVRCYAVTAVMTIKECKQGHLMG